MLIVFLDFHPNEQVWDSLSDSKLRSFLVKHDILTADTAAQLKRHELEPLVAQHWNRAEENYLVGWDEVRAFNASNKAMILMIMPIARVR